MPRFSLKSLLLATTLISLGAGTLWCVFHYPFRTESPNPYWPLCWLGGGVLIGAGVGTPLRQWFLGGFLGLVIQIWSFGLVFDN